MLCENLRNSFPWKETMKLIKDNVKHSRPFMKPDLDLLPHHILLRFFSLHTFGYNEKIFSQSIFIAMAITNLDCYWNYCRKMYLNFGMFSTIASRSLNVDSKCRFMSIHTSLARFCIETLFLKFKGMCILKQSYGKSQNYNVI